MNKEEIIKALRDMAKYPTVTLPRDSEALKAAADLLAQPEQEPVAWAENDGEGNVLWNEESCFSDDPDWLDNPMPLYTTPPQRKPLTDEEIKQDFEKWAKDNYVQGFELYGDSYHNGHTRNRWQGWLAAHRAIEAAHGIKE